jgi:hypothetical protein
MTQLQTPSTSSTAKTAPPNNKEEFSRAPKVEKDDKKKPLPSLWMNEAKSVESAVKRKTRQKGKYVQPDKEKEAGGEG